MEGITKKTLGNRDIFGSIASRLSIPDVTILMSLCKRLKFLGIQWLQTRGRGWLPEGFERWECDELRLAALWAFGEPRCVFKESVETWTQIEVSSRCVWKASSDGVVIQRGRDIIRKEPTETVLKYPQGVTPGHPNLALYQCGEQNIAVVGVGRWHALVPENVPRWVPLCDQVVGHAVGPAHKAKWIVLFLRNRQVKWSLLETVVGGGQAIWKSAPIPDRLIPHDGSLPEVMFPEPDKLAVVIRVWNLLERGRLDLKVGKWGNGQPNRHREMHPAHVGMVRVGEREPYRVVFCQNAFALQLNREPIRLILRTCLTSQFLFGIVPEKVRALRAGDSPLIFVQYCDSQYQEHAAAFLLERPTTPLDLSDAIRAGARLEELDNLLLEAVERNFQQLIMQAIHARRSEVVKRLISLCVSSQDARLPYFNLGYCFYVAATFGETDCAQALLNSGCLSIAVPPAGREWPLAGALESALERSHWQIVTDVLELFREPTEGNDRARLWIMTEFYKRSKQQVGGNLAQARKLFCTLITQQPTLLRYKGTAALSKKLDVWRQNWGLLLPIDLSAKWNSDQERWELKCQKQKSVCWELIRELRAGCLYEELRLLITRWLELPLFEGTNKALKALLKVNPAFNKRRKLQ